MNDLMQHLESGIIIVLILGVSLASAADNQLTKAEQQAGFVSLFNSQNLDGWDGDPRFWSVQNGAIRGETTPEKITDGNTFCIWRGGKLKNFILKIKFRITNGNSGIQYRSRDLGNWVVSGYQAEVENKPGKVGFLYEEKNRGWMVNVGDFMVVERDLTGQLHKMVVGKVADVNSLIENGYYKNQDWNEYTIICRGNHLVHYLNGYITIEMIDNDTSERSMEGILALQIHAGPPMVVEFKDIRLKHLPDHFGLARRLFNGVNLNGWTGSDDNQNNAWSVTNEGALATSGAPIGYLRTTDDFTSYILRLQLRHLSTGNGGVLLRLLVGEDEIWPRSIEAQGQFQAMGDIWNIDKFPMRTDPDRTQGRHTAKMYPTNEKPVGGWNEYQITLDGENLQLQVNGLLQNTATNCWVTPGKIGLQSEGSPMEYRNMVLIPIETDKH